MIALSFRAAANQIVRKLVCNRKEIGEVLLAFVVGADVDRDDNIGPHRTRDLNGHVIGDTTIHQP
ncbi:Uncharacterised protein [Vibrio cholerae]|nr:Uncharacterised protein [Vibrio cholerae]CSB28403.1 Uncharacterised protein [Vibrio cholerae]CSB60820.1 Uncharacterised protein [Vibrio cholerae]CSB66780.1 Uncharacterised protein [Vibrio cholerae]CSC11405.1 Uncharacterised protein [Vibrio cholerae]